MDKTVTTNLIDGEPDEPQYLEDSIVNEYIYTAVNDKENSLFELSKEWLNNDESCNSNKDIIDRLEYLETSYLSYLKTLELKTKCDISYIITDVKGRFNSIKDVFRKYLRGDLGGSLTVVGKLVSNMKSFVIEEEIDSQYFRARASTDTYSYKNPYDLFHVPFDKRYSIDNYRYSISGLPCLYMGGSTYTCWEELKRPEQDKCNYARLKNRKKFMLLDLSIPTEFTNEQQLINLPILLSCALRANRTYHFKAEYILSQQILQCIIRKRKHNRLSIDSVIGVRYLSTSYLYGEQSLLDTKTDLSQLNLFYCYAVPIINIKDKKKCLELDKLFEISNPISMMEYKLLSDGILRMPNGVHDGRNYKITIFYYLEEFLKTSSLSTGYQVYWSNVGCGSEMPRDSCENCKNFEHKTDS